MDYEQKTGLMGAFMGISGIILAGIVWSTTAEGMSTPLAIAGFIIGNCIGYNLFAVLFPQIAIEQMVLRGGDAEYARATAIVTTVLAVLSGLIIKFAIDNQELWTIATITALITGIIATMRLMTVEDDD